MQGRDLEKAKALLAQAGYADGVTLDLYYGSNPHAKSWRRNSSKTWPRPASPST